MTNSSSNFDGSFQPKSSMWPFVCNIMAFLFVTYVSLFNIVIASAVKVFIL